MRKYILLAETGADIPKDIVKEYGLYIVPMHVSFDDTTKDDGSFPTTDLFAFYKTTGRLPKTSACNIGDFTDMFDKIHREHPDGHIIFLAYSAVTTASYQSAVIASEGRDYISILDTKHVSAGQALVVTLVARYIKNHPEASLEEILEQATYYRDHVKMGFLPGDLDYLRAGGRVSNAAYMGAKLLSLNPLIEIQNGYLMATKKYRGKMDRIAGKLLKDFSTEQNLSTDILFFVYSAGFSEDLKRKLTEEATSMGYKEIRWVETGCVVSTHSGPGAFGVVGISQ